MVILFESCGELGGRGSDELDQLRGLLDLGPVALDHNRRMVARLWWRACCQAVELEEADWLADPWPGGSSAEIALSALRDEPDVAARAETMLHLARVANLVLAGALPHQVRSELRRAADAWPSDGPGPTLHPFPRLTTGENPHVDTVNGLFEKLAAESPGLDLFALRELLWELLGESGWSNGSGVEVRFLLDEGQAGFVVTITAERRTHGGGRCFRDPRDLTGVLLRRDLLDSVATAWNFARSQQQSGGTEDEHDVRWRVSVPGGRREIAGTSGGASFVVAFLALLSAEPIRIDPTVALTGTVDEQGTIGEVYTAGYVNKLEAAHQARLRVIVPSADLERARDRAPRGLHLSDAADAKAALTDASMCGPLYGVPPLPADYRPTPDVGRVTTALLGRTGGAAVVGPPGAGKSVVANAAVRAPEVRRRFVDGIVWVRPHASEHEGRAWSADAPQPDPVLTEVVEAVEAVLTRTDVDLATDRLQRAVRDVSVLLVLDDVGDNGRMKAFERLGPRVGVLVTTRSGRVARAVGGTTVPVPPTSTFPAYATVALLLLSVVLASSAWIHRGSSLPSSGTVTVQGQVVDEDTAVPLDVQRRIPVRVTGGPVMEASDVQLVTLLGGVPVCPGPVRRITAICPKATLSSVGGTAASATLDFPRGRFLVAGTAQAELRLSSCGEDACRVRFEIEPRRRNSLVPTAPLLLAGLLLGVAAYSTRLALDPSDVRPFGLQVATVLVPWTMFLMCALWLLNGANPLGTAIWLIGSAGALVALRQYAPPRQQGTGSTTPTTR